MSCWSDFGPGARVDGLMHDTACIFFKYAHTQKLVTRVSATNTMNAGTFRGVKRPL
ncbi:hypothetical protein PISMIDRAFT_15918 [Pisolithus microcarpus 441]|uniref:Unplaced genomic scaffold scaffold_178, whole genome shotgun sequence n=1 Tax=Pisolithus microcarpus 441 TaxID=765257 RepID=A0A0C9Z1P2_9AGAM|nr:hypothetical protein PISMIDRAFT_15918 [Pisolithus microcarpus 441]